MKEEPNFLTTLLEGAAVMCGLCALSLALSLTFFTIVIIGNGNQITISK